MSSFAERKALRSKEYASLLRHKTRKCIACNGSGHYDNDNSPPCSSCNVTGKERYLEHNQNNQNNP